MLDKKMFIIIFLIPFYLFGFNNHMYEEQKSNFSSKEMLEVIHMFESNLLLASKYDLFRLGKTYEIGIDDYNLKKNKNKAMKYFYLSGEKGLSMGYIQHVLLNIDNKIMNISEKDIKLLKKSIIINDKDSNIAYDILIEFFFQIRDIPKLKEIMSQKISIYFNHEDIYNLIKLHKNKILEIDSKTIDFYIYNICTDYSNKYKDICIK